jgi:hypothetical protein
MLAVNSVGHGMAAYWYCAAAKAIRAPDKARVPFYMAATEGN